MGYSASRIMLEALYPIKHTRSLSNPYINNIFPLYVPKNIPLLYVI